MRSTNANGQICLLGGGRRLARVSAGLYWTQGETLDDLKEHLRDLHADLTNGQLSGIRKLGDLAIS
jgi:hypothetical protein